MGTLIAIGTILATVLGFVVFVLLRADARRRNYENKIAQVDKNVSDEQAKNNDAFKP